ncbi:MAG: YfhO family protein [Thermoflexales bacterium]|nr:YfhO family protein [Thermoflexales bacterium]
MHLCLACLDGLGLLALVVLVFWKLALTNLVIARGDVLTYFYPYLDYAAEATRQGRLPLWNPYLFMGVPFLANSQAGFFYPLNRLLSWLAVTRAVSVTIVLHAWLAGLGAYALARKSLRLGRAAAWTAGAAFAAGGCLAAQVEHVNQLQGLAWLPWLVVCFDGWRDASSAPGLRRAWLGLVLIVALQLLAGHTQTAFISLFGLGVYVVLSCPLRPWRAWGRQLAALAGAVLLGAGLAAAQLLPTFELTRWSIRSEGLSWREAVSFSLKPSLLGRALLPGYGQALFPEYVAYLGLAGLALAAVGLAAAWRGRGVRPASRRLLALAVLAGLGLFFALGAYNPVYLLLVRFAPGFGLFRVPARWLACYAFGMASLAGAGLDWLARSTFGSGTYERPLPSGTLPSDPLLTKNKDAAPFGIGSIVSLALETLNLTLAPARSAGEPETIFRLALVGWGAACAALATLAFYAANTLVPGPDQPAGYLNAATWGGWLVAAGLVIFSLWKRPRWGGLALLGVMVVELFAASLSLPFNRATAPEALTSLRPSILGLKSQVSGFRFLSLSDIFFDPGDKAELESAFADQLSADAFYDLLVATKQKEIVAPNLPLYYRLPGADGFDGGILPLRDYVRFQVLFMPPGETSPDGRLREVLRDVPDGRWLSLMNVRYVITDKTLDGWVDGVFYDLQFSTSLRLGGASMPAIAPAVAAVARVPRFEATALGVVSYLQGAAHLPQGTPVAQVVLGFDDGTSQAFVLRAGVETAEGVYTDDVAHRLAQVGGHFVRDHPEIADYVTRLRWGEPRGIVSVEVRPWLESPASGEAGELVLRGVSLIDEAADKAGGGSSFQSLVISGRGRFARVHSGDVKIYENLGVLPRAFVVPEAIVSEGDAALTAMRDPGFDPARQVLLEQPLTAPPTAPCLACVYTATLALYQPERVVVDVEASGPGWLVLTDSYYPGWRASLDGQPVSISRADLLFRAVPVPAGAHRVEFIYDPLSLKLGAAISLLALAVAGLAGISVHLRLSASQKE